MIDKIEKDESQLVTCGFKKIFSKEEMLLKNSENVNLTANIKEYLEILKENYLYNDTSIIFVINRLLFCKELSDVLCGNGDFYYCIDLDYLVSI